MKKISLSFIILFLSLAAYAQYVPVTVFNNGIYDFLDDMANLHYIQLYDAVKPYSRMFIAQALTQIDEQKDKLTSSQQKELEFYLKDYNKELLPAKTYKKRLDLFYYKDSTINITVNPVEDLVIL